MSPSATSSLHTNIAPTHTVQSDMTAINTVSNSESDELHAVFAEYGTATWCGYCKYAHAALKNIYAGGWYPFYYVSFVTDKNIHAQSRMENQYNINGYPTVYFDGGYGVHVGVYTHVPRLMNWYNTTILNCTTREVADINASLSVEWIAEASMEIHLSIQNCEVDAYDGYLRVYVTELMSTMGWEDTNGDPYTFAFLDYAFNEEIHINANDAWQDSTIWNGANHTDGYGHNFSEIRQDNIMVIAVVFNNTWHQGYSNPPYGNPFDAYYVDEIVQIGSHSPRLEIRSIIGKWGGFSNGGVINVEIWNIGEKNATNVRCNISINGGILEQINVTDHHFTNRLNAGSFVNLITGPPIFGVGRIMVTVTASAPYANPVEKKAAGVIIGPFIFGLHKVS